MPAVPDIAPGSYVLDTHALLALVQDEPGADLVSALIERAAADATLNLSLINFGEIAYILEREQGTARATELLETIRQLPVTLYEVTEARILAAAHIKAHHRVSYADAFAIALAQELNATLVTGDPEIHATSGLVPLLWL